MRSIAYSSLDHSFPYRRNSGALEILSEHFWFCLAVGVGVQCAIGLGAALLQAITLGLGWHATSMDWPALLIVTVFGIPFSMGGATARILFEALAQWRSDVVLSHMNVYLPILGGQVLFVAALLGWRLRQAQRMSDWVFRGMVALLILNSLVNLFWPWWGT